MKAIANNPAIFEGQEDRKAITYNAGALQSNLYLISGRMISWAIMHGDIGVPVLSKSMYYFISHKDVDITETPYCVEDIPDCSIVDLIRKARPLYSTQMLNISKILGSFSWSIDRFLMTSYALNLTVVVVDPWGLGSA